MMYLLVFELVQLIRLESYMSNVNVIFHDNHPSLDDMYQDVVDGFGENPRTIPPKYFYDEKGSKLFDLITESNDYYPTRAEVSIFRKYKQEIVEGLPNSCVLIEPGGGSHAKVLIFISELQPSIYVPIDISKHYLKSSTQQLAEKLPWLQIHAVCDDFTKQLQVPTNIPGLSRVVFFPGSSIGNFHPNEVIQYLKNISKLVGDTGHLLIGVDLKKNKSVLEKAYDDSEGITAQFNLNLLARINDELTANFDLRCWQHHAIYDENHGRIEMHLKSSCEQVVDIQDHQYYFAEGEIIHTENSYKYSVNEFVDLASQSGFISKKVWLDDDELFSVHLFQVR